MSAEEDEVEEEVSEEEKIAIVRSFLLQSPPGALLQVANGAFAVGPPLFFSLVTRRSLVGLFTSTSAFLPSLFSFSISPFLRVLLPCSIDDASAHLLTLNTRRACLARRRRAPQSHCRRYLP